MQTTDKIIFEFPVLWEGWECDSVGWIMERESGTRYAKMTNHGTPYIAPLHELITKILEYESAINKTKLAIALVGTENKGIYYDYMSGGWRNTNNTEFFVDMSPESEESCGKEFHSEEEFWEWYNTCDH